MGFNPRRIELALKNSNGTLDACIQWLEDNQDRLVAGENMEPVNEKTSAEITAVESDKAVESANEEPSSDQPKILTEEEKSAKLDQLRARAAVRKAEAAKKDAEEQRQNELLRRKNNVEEIKRREELQHKEVQKEAARRKMEAKEELLAKKKIKELIEQDRKARAEKKGNNVSANCEPTTSSKSATSASVPKPPRAEPTQARLRLRIQSTNAQLVETFPLDATLSQVADKVSSQVGAPSDKLFFLTTFPTKRFTTSDYQLTLKQAGLVNTSVVVGW